MSVCMGSSCRLIDNSTYHPNKAQENVPSNASTEEKVGVLTCATTMTIRAKSEAPELHVVKKKN